MIFTILKDDDTWRILKNGKEYTSSKDKNAVYDTIVELAHKHRKCIITVHPSARMSAKRFTRDSVFNGNHVVQRFMVTDGLMTVELLNWSVEEHADRKRNPSKYYLDMRKRKDVYERKTWDEGDGRILFAEDSPYFMPPAPLAKGGDDE